MKFIELLKKFVRQVSEATQKVYQMRTKLPRQASELIPTVFLILITTILGCTNENKRNYRIDEVQARVVTEASAPTANTYIVFSALLETQFHSPGVKVRRDKENTHIEFIRAAIRDKAPTIDLKAEYLTKWVKDNNLPVALKEKLLNNSSSAEQIIVMPWEVRKLYITDGKNEKIIGPKF